MTATQTQIRHGTDAEVAAATPVNSELLHNRTTGRLSVGDGVTAGGLMLPLSADIQKQSHIYASAGGTANALTLALIPVPAAWVAGMRLAWKATANNTGAATIAVTGLSGTKTLKRMVSGSLADLAADDMANGGVYEGIYDGTYVQISSGLSSSSGGLLSISQGDLNTSTGTVSGSAPATTQSSSAGGTSVTLPGGEYGFFPQSKDGVSAPSGGTKGAQFWALTNTSASYVTALTPMSSSGDGVSQSLRSLAAKQRYITSSPPFDMGDGAVGGFVFVLVNSAGDIVAHYAADVPPWAYNGPTNIMATKKDPVTGRKYRRVMAERSLEEIMDGAAIQYEFQEITQAIKNADMALIPHPFGVVPPGHHVVLLDPMDTRLAKLIEYQNAGGVEEIVGALRGKKIQADNEPLSRRGPPGVMQARLKFKSTRK